MIRITSKRKLPLWGLTLGSLVATSLSTGMTEATETKAPSPKPGFLQSTLCKVCPKVPQNNTLLDNCIRNCPEAVKTTMDALIAQKKQKNGLVTTESGFINEFKNKPQEKIHEKHMKDAEKRKAKLDSEIKVLTNQINKIDQGINRVIKALDGEIQSKEQKLSQIKEKHTQSAATKGLNQRDIAKQDKEIKPVNDQIKKLEERKQRIDNLFFGNPSEAGAPPPLPPRDADKPSPGSQGSMGTPIAPSPQSMTPPPPVPRDPSMETQKIIPSHPSTQPTRVPPPLPQATTEASAPPPVSRPPLPTSPRPTASGSTAQPPASANPSPAGAPGRPPRPKLQAAMSTDAPPPPPPPSNAPPLPARPSGTTASAGSPQTDRAGLLASLTTENPMGRLKKATPSTPSSSSDAPSLSPQDKALLDQRIAKAPDTIKEELQNKIRRANNNPVESKRYKAQLAYVESKMPSGMPNDEQDW